MWPWPDFDLKVKLKVDLLKSSDISFDLSRRDKHDGTNSFLISLKPDKLSAKNQYKEIFEILAPGGPIFGRIQKLS